MNAMNILLVEDNPADQDLARETFEDSRHEVSLHLAADGIDALDVVNRRGVHADAPRPDLILLDLNLPRLNGREVLKQIKEDGKLRAIPVIVMSSSDAEADIHASYALGANCFVIKPIDYGAFRKIMRSLEEFWFDAARLPGVEAPK